MNLDRRKRVQLFELHVGGYESNKRMMLVDHFVSAGREIDMIRKHATRTFTDSWPGEARARQVPRTFYVVTQIDAGVL